ncbi:MAG: HIT domain-containing protein [Nanoarchaeota archaeon]|mgnify:CR=1 FL=1
MEIEKIKSQLISQIKKSFPQDKQEHAISQIKKMNDDELIEFLEKNNIVKDFQNQECIFCSIINGKLPSYKITEDENSIAVLEINPISHGHAIVIPKNHAEKISRETEDFAEKISKIIKKELNPKKIEFFESSLFSHAVLNILPVYENETEKSQRKKATEEELINLQKTLSKEEIKVKKTTVKKTKPKIISEKNLWLPRRIP